MPLFRGIRQHDRGKRRQVRLVAEVKAGRVEAGGGEQVARQRYPPMRRTHRLRPRDLRHGVGHQLRHRHRRVLDAVHEGRIGAVLQQAADQVGQQRFVRADGGVDAARPVQPVVADDLLIQRLAHAVQALELVLAGGERGARHAVHGGDGVSVVGRELREHRVRRGQQLAGAGQVGDVRLDLAGEHGEAFQPVHLGALDLAIPVGALHQAHHEPVATAAGEVDDPVQNVWRAFLVGLDDEADAVPAGERLVQAQRLQQVERQVEPVGFLGVDVQADVVVPREQGQGMQARQEFGDHALALQAGVARVQRGQLDGDAGTAVDAAAVGRAADGVDRPLVFAVVASGVLRRRGRLAQHVVGVAEAALLEPPRVLQRLADVLPGNELLAHHAHRHVHPAADHRLAAARDDAGERRAQAGFARGAGQLAGDDQAPGRGVHEQGRRMAEMAAPVPGADLVADQRVARGPVRDAEQRLRQAHQGDAFLAGQVVFPHQALDGAARAFCA